MLEDKFKYSTRDNGLPGKSYMWILSIDYHIKSFLSIICRLPEFENYITSLLKRYHRSKDRSKETINYLNFLVTEDESRLNFIYQSKTFSRKEAIKFIHLFYKDIVTVKKLNLRLINKEVLSIEEYTFYNNFIRAWRYCDVLYYSIVETYRNVQDIIKILYDNFKSYILKKLMSKRKSEPNPNLLLTDVYEIIIDMIDQYSLRTEEDNPETTKKGKGKIPFIRQLDWIIKNKKNFLIMEETEGLSENVTIMSMTEEEDEASTDNRSIMTKVEFSLQENKEDVGIKNYLTDISIDFLPKYLRELVMVNYSLLEPLSQQEKIEMMAHYNNSVKQQ